jgi:hypothetical protein
VQDLRLEAKISACILNMKQVHSAIASLFAVWYGPHFLQVRLES